MDINSVLLIILAACLSLGLAAFQYKQSSGSLQTRLILASLRFVSYFCLALLLINPKITKTSYNLEKANLIIAVDNSQSIKHLGKSQIVKDIVDSLKLNKALNNKFKIETYSFGDKLVNNDSLNFKENQTNITSAFNALNEVYNNQVAPTILITDGNQTFGEAYQYSAERYNQPVIPIVVGDTATFEDLSLSQVNTNRYAFVDNKFPIEVFSTYAGNKEVSTVLEVLQNKRIVSRKNLRFSPENSAQVTQINLPVNSVGLKTYTVRLQNLNNEKNKTNNSKRFGIEVIDERTNVLIISSILHPDLGMLKKAIQSNKQRQVTIKRSNDNTINLEDYQLVILYQPKANFAKYFKELNDIESNVFIITGTDTDYRFLNEQQQIFSRELSGQQENYQAFLNINYNVFQIEDIGFSEYPPLKDSFGEVSISGSYNTILNQVVSGVKTEQPLLLTTENDTKRYGVLFGEGLWRWRAQSFIDTNSFQSFDDFIGKLVQYLASKKRRSRLDVNHNSFYNGGEKITISAQYFDKNYVFDDSADLSMVIVEKKSQDRREVPLILKNNRYEVDLSSLPSGSYEYTLMVGRENLTRSGSFEIIEYNVEQQFLNANVAPLQQIASKKSQRLYFNENTSNLIADLLENNDYKPIQKQQKTISPLIDWYYLLLIIIAALSLEWFTRKYNGLI